MPCQVACTCPTPSTITRPRLTQRPHRAPLRPAHIGPGLGVHIASRGQTGPITCDNGSGRIGALRFFFCGVLAIGVDLRLERLCVLEHDGFLLAVLVFARHHAAAHKKKVSAPPPPPRERLRASPHLSDAVWRGFVGRAAITPAARRVALRRRVGRQGGGYSDRQGKHSHRPPGRRGSDCCCSQAASLLLGGDLLLLRRQ